MTNPIDRKRIAAVAVLLGGTVLACAGLAQGYDGQTSGECTTDAQGNISCVHTQKSQTTYTSADGTVHVNQSQSCSTSSESRVYRPEVSQGQQGTTRIGPTVDCSNHVPAPAGFVPPHIVIR
jgi:hypothetical protein